MSANSLGSVGYTLGLTVWVIAVLIIGQSLAAILVVYGLPPLNTAVETTVLAALGYTFGLALALGIPALLLRGKWIDRPVLGIDRLPSWTDIGLAILAVLPYYLLSGIIMWVGMEVLNVIDPDVGQQIGFSQPTKQLEFIVTFMTLVVLAPLAEELLFRGYFLGSLNKKTSKWLAVIVTAVVFGLLHLPGFTDSGVVLQWGAAADTFGLGLIAGALRQLTGGIWAGVLLHAIKNSIAYYFLFISDVTPGGM